MGALYNIGEQKIRPGVYRRYEKVSSDNTPGAIYGVFAITVHSDLGPLETVSTFAKDEMEEFKEMYGTGGTTDAVIALFNGGATKIYVYRLGTGGSKASIALKNTEATELVTLTTKSETGLEFNVTIKEKLGATNIKQLFVYNDKKLLETLEFDAGENEIDNLVTIVDSLSVYLDAEKKADGTLAPVSNTKLTGGSAPTATNDSYADAFSAFEAFKWNMLVLDTCDTSVHAVTKAYIDRIYLAGALGVCFIGEPTTVSFDTRKLHASTFNDEKIIYAGSGYELADGTKVDGYLSVATQAGLVGSLESNKSATHTAIPNAVATLEDLKNSQYESAIKNGMLLLSKSDDGQIWFDSGVNTLVKPGVDQDDGWKKIRRMTTRFEMFDRIDRALAPLIGKVDCDDIGIGDCVLRGQAVLDAMIAESKLYDGATFSEDTTKKRGSDYAYFVIAADDKDSLEKIYLTYQFRFTAE